MIETFVYDSKGKNLIKTEGAPPKAALLENKDLRIWINLYKFTEAEARSVLQELFRFHPLTYEDCVDYDNYPKIEDYDDYTFLIFRGAKYAERKEGKPSGNDKDVEAREIDFYIGDNYLISVHKSSIVAIPSVMSVCEKNPQGTIGKGTDYLLYLILDKMMEYYQPMLDEFEEQIDKFEEEIFNSVTHATLSGVLALKRDISTFRRILIPQREVINRVARGECPQVSPKVAIYFRDVADSLYRTLDLIENYREFLTGIQETYLSIISNQMNKTALTLTVIATVILIPSFIASFFGMNVENLPFSKSQYGPAIVLVLMIAITWIIIALLKKKKWF